jgi:hypothetical protein
MKSSKIKRNSPLQRLLAGLCGTMLALSAGQPGFAQQSAFLQPAAAASPAKTNIAANEAALQPTPAQEPKESQGVAPAKPGGEGIRVHGHWVIDVKNPDGSLAEHREFDNSLVTGQNGGGDTLLVGLISGALVPGGYTIQIGGFSGTCGPGTSCSAQTSNISSPTLTANFPDATSNVSSTAPPSFVLAGSFTSTYTGTLNSVATGYTICLGGNAIPPTLPSFPLPTVPEVNISPSQCFSANADLAYENYSSTFTATTLTSPMPVTSGQLVQVTVTISFS